IRNTQYENIQNEPNLQGQMNVSPAITKDYSLAQPGELLRKIINQSRPKADSTNIHDHGEPGINNH
ncbi:MAG: hypothetical protein ACYSWP_21735, partial [Planctomycetota bacterium]